ncbi:beta strand repeat-containing protein, partial [Rhizobium paknamense]
TVKANVSSYTLSNYIETLEYIGTGNFTGTGNDQDNTIIGGDGNDTLSGEGGADKIIGGAGTDTVSYATSTSGVTVNLKTGTASGGDAEGDRLSGIENLIGSGYADTLTGTDGDNTITAGSGNDILEGGKGADTLLGGNGTDTASYASSSAAVQIDLVSGTYKGGDAEGDVLNSIENFIGSAYADTFTAASATTLAGGKGNDTYIVSQGASTIVLVEAANEGTDTVKTTVTNYTLLANFENLTHTADTDFTGYGNSSNNIIISQAGDDKLYGYAGNDTIRGGDGADVISGGDGSDMSSYIDSDKGVSIDLTAGTASGGYATGDVLTGIENLEGSYYDDVLIGDANANLLIGGDGVDELRGGDGDDTLRGGAKGDIIDGGAGNDTISYLDSYGAVTVNLKDWTFSGGYATGDVVTNVENVEGSTYSDTLIGDDGNNTLSGASGNDVLIGGAGADILIGGEGEGDWVDYTSSSAGVTVNLTTKLGAGGDAEGDSYATIEYIRGSAFDDVLTGDSLNNQLVGGDGNDILNGGSGNDTLIGGLGADQLNGGLGTGDIASYADATSSVILNIATGTGEGYAAGDVLTGIEIYTGGNYDDVFIGGTLAARYNGGAGDDSFLAGTGTEIIQGGDGTDTLSYASSASAVSLNLITGAGSGGSAAGDTFSGVEIVVGSSFDDSFTTATDTSLIGGLGNDTYDLGTSSSTVTEVEDGGIDLVKSSAGSFTLSDHVENLVYTGSSDFIGVGNAAANVLTGGIGNDTLYGLSGDDRLLGGAGSDALYGGEGSDVFVFTTGDGNDTIYDFEAGSDQIDLSGFGYATLDDAASLASEIDGGVLFSFANGDSLTVLGLDYASLHTNTALL